MYSGSEEIGFLTVCANLSLPTERDVSVMIITTSGTASGEMISLIN